MCMDDTAEKRPLLKISFPEIAVAFAIFGVCKGFYLLYMLFKMYPEFEMIFAKLDVELPPITSLVLGLGISGNLLIILLFGFGPAVLLAYRRSANAAICSVCILAFVILEIWYQFSVRAMFEPLINIIERLNR